MIIFVFKIRFYFLKLLSHLFFFFFFFLNAGPSWLWPIIPQVCLNLQRELSFGGVLTASKAVGKSGETEIMEQNGIW